MVPVVCWSVLKTTSLTRILEISLTFVCPSHDGRFVLNAEIMVTVILFHKAHQSDRLFLKKVKIHKTFNI